MEGPISYWGHKEQESNLILPEHDDDDEQTSGLLRIYVMEKLDPAFKRILIYAFCLLKNYALFSYEYWQIVNWSKKKF